MKKILIINGPNLNMLGKRDPKMYGTNTIDEIYNQCIEKSKTLNCKITFKQSNYEGEIIDYINSAVGCFDGLIINAGAYTHSSIAIMDALEILTIPIVEIHLTNIFKREDFRQVSYISKVAKGVISGFGLHGYLLALEAMKKLID